MIGNFDVPAACVGLPEFDERVGQRLTGAVEHTQTQPNALARRIRPRHHAVTRFGVETDVQIRANGLRARGHERRLLPAHARSSQGVALSPRSTMSNT